MAVLLMKLRLVPDDELAEIEALLEQHELEFYSTSAGSWGISLPALWLLDGERLQEAKALLESYASERQAQSRQLYESMKESGKQRTMLDIARESPLRFVLSLAMVAALLYVSLIAFW
jgi:hypothetical protein